MLRINTDYVKLLNTLNIVIGTLRGHVLKTTCVHIHNDNVCVQCHLLIHGVIEVAKQTLLIQLLRFYSFVYETSNV